MKKSIFLFFLLALWPVRLAMATHPVTDDFEALRARLEAMPPMEMDEILWLARCIYSESNKANEQEHIAWVVRNRVNTQYRGENYREVILEPLQFSLFNTNSTRRNYILGLNQNSNSKPWVSALNIALKIYQASPEDRPFSKKTRHFYSPVSMKNSKTPAWAKNATPLNSESFDIDPERFLFFEEIDQSKDPFLALKTPGERIDEVNESTREKLQPVRSKSSIRDRLKPSGRVARPMRPSNTKRKTTKRAGW
ncbi:MAG: cell wall hydrolase [Bacteroidota bacterium]